MALIHFFDDIFGEVSKTEHYEAGETLKKIINKYVEEKDSIQVAYEVYDIESGETTYVIPEVTEYKTICIVNNEEQLDLNYKIKDDDIVSFTLIPMSEDTGRIFNYVAGSILAVGGIILAAAFSWTGVGGYIGGTLAATGISMLIGQIASDVFNKQKDSSSDSNNDKLKEAEDVLGLSGGSNQDIIDHRYPVILGKHIINPYVVGSYYNTTLTLDKDGNDGGQYLTQLYCVGYGPLKLTDFKIGDILLSYNRSNDLCEKRTLMHGVLSGCNDDDTGDILNKWKNNDVSLEILQAGSLCNSKNEKWGKLYNQVVEQIEPNANLLNLKDGEIKELATRSYLGTSIPNGFKSNSVRFSHACPKRLEVEIEFPNGLYAYRTYVKDGATIFYYDLPVRLAIQWRYIKNNQASSNADSPEGWHNFDYVELSNGDTIPPSPYSLDKQRFDYESSLGRKTYDYTSSWINEDVFSFGGFSYPFENPTNLGYSIDITSTLNINYTGPKSNTGGTITSQITVNCSRTIILTKEQFHRLYKKNSSNTITSDYFSTFELNSKYSHDFYNIDSLKSVLSEIGYSGEFNDLNVKTDIEAVGLGLFETFVVGSYRATNISKASGCDFYSVYNYIGGTSAKDIIGFSSVRISDYSVVNLDSGSSNVTNIMDYPINKDKINVNARRYVAVKNFTPDECATIINYNNKNESDLDSVEVRVIRLSPLYLEEYNWGDSTSGTDFTTYHRINSDWTGMKYNDLSKWTKLRTFCFDKEDFKNGLDKSSITDIYDYKEMDSYPMRPVNEEDLDKFSFIALRLKQDAAETGGSSLNALSCIAQNFVPNYRSNENKWYPETINLRNRFYRKSLDINNDYLITDISEKDYLYAKEKKRYISLYLDTFGITTEFFKSSYGYYLSTDGLRYEELTDVLNLEIKINSEIYKPQLIYDEIKAGKDYVLTEGIYISYKEGINYSGLCIINNVGNLEISVYKKDNTIKPSEYYKTNKGTDFIDQLKVEVLTSTDPKVDIETLKLPNGIDLTNRPIVSKEDLIAAGWTDAVNDNYSVYPVRYNNEKIVALPDLATGVITSTWKYSTIFLVLDPINKDGSIKTKAELQNLANQTFTTMESIYSEVNFGWTDNTLEVEYLITGKEYAFSLFDTPFYKAIYTVTSGVKTQWHTKILSVISNVFYFGTDEQKNILYKLITIPSNNITSMTIKSIWEDLGQEYPASTLLESQSIFDTQFIKICKQFHLIRYSTNESLYNTFELTEQMDSKYCSQNIASQALYSLIGPHVGIDAKTYDDVNIKSFTDLYNFCEDVTDGTKLNENEPDVYGDGLKHMKFTCNGIVSSEIKLESLLEKILLCGRSYVKRDEQNRYEVLIGRPTDYPVGVINQKNIISKSNTRSYEDEISGYLVSFVDETDNYTQNNIYIMNDGEDFKNPTKEISSLSLPYVTNREQVYSLARFNLVVKLYQKEYYTRTVGRMGYRLSLGDVLMLQDDSLLIGKEHGARIQKLITSEDKKYLYGIEIDDPITFTGEDRFGCTIVQPEKYGASRCVTLEFCGPEGCDIGDGKFIEPAIGITNQLYFKRQISMNEASFDEETADLVQVLPKVGNLVAFGNINAITEKVIVMGIKPKEKDQFELSLVPYNPDLYNMGTKLPVFTSNMTLPSREEMQVDFNDYTRKSETEEATQDTTQKLTEYVTEEIETIKEQLDINEFTLDISPEVQSIPVTESGEMLSTEFTISAYLYYMDRQLTENIEYHAYLSDGSEVGTWNDNIVTIKTYYLSGDILYIDIKVSYTQADESVVERTLRASVNKLYGGSDAVIYKMQFPDGEKIKISTDGTTMDPATIRALKKKVTPAGEIDTDYGYITVEAYPNGSEINTDGYDKIGTEEEYNSNKTYYGKFTPLYIKLNSNEYLSDSNGDALIFYTRSKE